MRTRKLEWHLEESGLSRRQKRQLRREVEKGVEVPTEKVTRKDARLPTTPVPFYGNGLTEGGWWNLQSTKVDPHRATTNDLAGIYPFVADSGIGMRAPILGVDQNADSLFCWSPWHSYADNSARGSMSTNLMVLGAYRAGKSGSIKTLAWRSIPWGFQTVVPSDSKGEWTGLAEAIEGGVVISLGGPLGQRLNPLARGPMRTDASVEQDVKLVEQRRITTLVQLLEMVSPSKALTAAEHAAVVLALNLAIDSSDDHPTIREVHHQMGRIQRGEVEDVEKKPKEAAEDIRLLLARFVTGDLSGLFEDESTVEFDQDAPIVVVDTSELFQRSELVAQIAQVCTTSWVQAVISDRKAGRKRYLIREEGWRDMTSVQSLMMYQQWLKLSRHYGVANVIILHKMGDLDAVGPEGSRERALAYSVVQDIENKFIFHVNRQEEDNLRSRLNLPPSHVQVARRLQKGEFLAYVGNFSYVVDCFATSTPAEFELFKTDDAVMTDRAVRNEQDPAPQSSLDELWPIATTDHDDANLWLAAASATNGGEQ